MRISSKQNPKIQQVVKLNKRSEREEQGLFLIEGYREVSRALAGGYPLLHLFICPELFLGSNEESLLETLHVPVIPCTEMVFRSISYRDRPDGFLAVAPIQRRRVDDLPLPHSTPFYVVAEAIEKPGNLGTILRSADGAGADGVILVDGCTDLFNPNVVRASVGTLFTQPVVEATSQELTTWLLQHDMQVVAATPAATIQYTQADLRIPLAILVGTEQYGLSAYWMERAHVQVSIPMEGVADSLNVAMATTLLLYEVHRQRHISS